MLMINYKEALPEEFHFKVMQKWNGKKNVKEEEGEEEYKKNFPLWAVAIQVVEFSSGGYKIRKIFASESTYSKIIIEF